MASQHQIIPINHQKNQQSKDNLSQQPEINANAWNDQANKANDDEKQVIMKKKCQCKPTKGCIIRLVIAALLVGFIIYLIVDFARVRQGFESFINWLQDNIALGIFILVIIYIFATVLFIPGLILTIGAGVALQAALKRVFVAILLGSVAVWIGAMIGSFLAMLLGRYLLRSTIEKKALKFRVFRAIDTALKTQGFKFTVLLRLCPLIPFSLLNYVFGLTSVSVRNYLFGGIGMIPGTVAYVYLGTTISNIAQASSGGFGGGPVELGLIIGGSILAIVAIVIVTIKAKKELNKLIQKEKQEQANKKKQSEQNAQNDNNSQNKEGPQQQSNENQNKKEPQYNGESVVIIPDQR